MNIVNQGSINTHRQSFGIRVQPKVTADVQETLEYFRDTQRLEKIVSAGDKSFAFLKYKKDKFGSLVSRVYAKLAEITSQGNDYLLVRKDPHTGLPMILDTRYNSIKTQLPLGGLKPRPIFENPKNYFPQDKLRMFLDVKPDKKYFEKTESQIQAAWGTPPLNSKPANEQKFSGKQISI